jgi:hypothetical protein
LQQHHELDRIIPVYAYTVQTFEGGVVAHMLGYAKKYWKISFSGSPEHFSLLLRLFAHHCIYSDPSYKLLIRSVSISLAHVRGEIEEEGAFQGMGKVRNKPKLLPQGRQFNINILPQAFFDFEQNPSSTQLYNVFNRYTGAPVGAFWWQAPYCNPNREYNSDWVKGLKDDTQRGNLSHFMRQELHCWRNGKCDCRDYVLPSYSQGCPHKAPPSTSYAF